MLNSLVNFRCKSEVEFAKLNIKYTIDILRNVNVASRHIIIILKLVTHYTLKESMKCAYIININ